MAQAAAPVEFSKTLAGRQAEWIASLTYESIPQEVRTRARLLLLDYLGVARRGATLPQVEPARALLADLDTAPQCGLVGGGRATAAYAAYANAAFGHALEYDDAHWLCGHPGVCVIPAVLALAEREGITGQALLTAIVAGYQSMVWSMGPINRRTLDIGWHGMKVGGVFGAAAGAAKVLGLDALQIANALAIAGSDASGTMEYDQSGGEVKRFHAGMASRAGLEAAVLAKAGLTGPLTIYEGLRGIHKLFSERDHLDPELLWDGTWHIMNTFVKLYPMVGTTHAALDAVGKALNELEAGAGPVRAYDIETIEIGIVDWAIPHGAAIFHPHDMLSAQFSLAFACALRVVRGQVAIMDLADPAIRADPAINALADRVKPSAMEVPAGSDPLFGHARVVLKDGRNATALQPAPRGHPANPAREEDIAAKFREVLAGLVSDDAIEAVLRAGDALYTSDRAPDFVQLIS
ncbi:MmgE/PrpD family protein [Croceicoccus sp. BE223]|uniref:MmgE/PrpD family protein n=1 Tax=Croceicoccus sp. BE223 TaxID=2817716 RepID=UPI00285F2F06|nr:MmgE/PrpD family protein [Croceicoccus sp. BE223]MDR7103656.1 2-methylcitrate dehydratase PrpD [Croceicoccus sp. BE223]